MNKVLGGMTEADFNKIMDEAIKKQPFGKNKLYKNGIAALQ